MTLSMARPDLTEREIELVTGVLRTPVLSGGPMLERFEAMVASYVGVPHAVGVSSGTAGLHLALVALGITDGDEVVTTPFSFVASANVILYERARPVFADIEPVSLAIDPAAAAAAVSPRTRAILPVHVFGHPADMPAVGTVARRHGLAVVEDACEALGTATDGCRVGGGSDAAVFAFYPNKQVTTGEGGMVVTASADVAGTVRSLRNQGRAEAGTALLHERLGYNYRLDELRSALGLAQMERVETLLAKRARVAGLYEERLKTVPAVTAPPEPPAGVTSRFVYVIRLTPPLHRDRIAERMAALGVPTRPYFVPIHLQPFYRERFGYRGGEFPVAEAAGRSTLALPFHGGMDEADIDLVCRALTRAVEQGR
jgi:perosamine synthetase